MKILLISILVVAFVSCKNANRSEKPETQKKDTIVVTNNTSSKINFHVDSINKANSITIQMDGEEVQKAAISKADSSIELTANIKLDHRIFGYEKPDTSSKKMILISIFTDDVKNNPFNCPFGAYYQTSDMKDIELKFIGNEGLFIKANVIKNKVVQTLVFIEKARVEFE